MTSRAVLTRFLLAGIGVVAGSDWANAQSSEPVHRVQDRVIVAGPGMPAQGIGPLPLDATFSWVSAEMSFGGRVVKGAPYAAEVLTETEQMLADGNRIRRTIKASVYRDSEGRTRREQTIGGIGPFVPDGDAPQMIIINDPVTGVTYMLQPGQKIAHKQPAMTIGYGAVGAAAVTSGGVRRELPDANGHRVDMLVTRGGPAMTPPAEESLGTRTIDGILVEGTRSVLTIEAGAIGNERPIEIVSERWYSPDLQVLVMTRHTDPRMGDTTYQLTNITRAEPSPDLFQVPPDYTISDSPAMFERRIERRPR